MKIGSKLPDVGTTIFTTMSALAREHGAINLSQGFPDFGCSPKLIELAHKYIAGGYNQYAVLPGAPELRERIAGIISTCYNSSYNPDTEITVTAGATQALYTAIAAFVHNGDEVLIFEPAYDCYGPSVELHGGIAVYSKLKETDFSIDWADVQSKISDKTRAIILNSPHNPSGAIISKNDLDELERLTRNTSIMIFSDEVYEHMVFDGEEHLSVCSRPALKERSILISSFGKTIHTTGWKIGYVAAPSELMKEFRKVHQFIVFVVNHPLQLAIAEFLADKNNYLGLRKFYQEKRDLFLKLTAGSRFVPVKTTGTYFQLMSFAAITEEKDTDFAVRLTREKKLAAIPLSAFYHEKRDPKMLRFCFAKKTETLEKAAAIMQEL